MDDSPEPDSAEKCIRFGCRFLGGGVIAFFVFLSGIRAFSGTFWVVVIGSALIFALLAMHYGDKAWHGLIRLLYWIWPW